LIHPIITLTTDFGLSDSYIGQVKGVILTLFPSASIIDISHTIPRYDVHAGALVLQEIVPRFPPGCIHIGIVDPGVGSERWRILIEADDGVSVLPYYLVGPDNGLLTRAAPPERRRRVWEIVHFDGFPTFSLPTTFEGRDIFAPTAALLARGRSPGSFGRELSRSSLVEIIEPLPEVKLGGEVFGTVDHFDSFGNAITNISARLTAQSWASVFLPGHQLKALRRGSYSEIPEGQLGVLVGSHGKLELAVRRGSAEKRFRLKIGDQVVVGRQTSGEKPSEERKPSEK